MLAVAYTGSCVGQQDKIGHLAHCYRQLMQISVLSDHRVKIGSITCVTVFLGRHFKIVSIILLSERDWCIL